MLINLSIYSKNSNSLTNFLKFFYRLESNKLFNFQLFTVQSQKKKKRFFFSVLKSPHVNKKSQDQFEYVTYEKNLKINILKLAQFLTICKIINTKIFHDINFKIKFLSIRTTHQHVTINKINSDIFVFKLFKKKKFLFSKITNQSLFKLLDLQGEIFLNKHYTSLDSSVGRAKD